MNHSSAAGAPAFDENKCPPRLLICQPLSILSRIIHAESDAAARIEADGEIVGRLSATIEVMPEALDFASSARRSAGWMRRTFIT